jgi:guanylate kinase
MTAARLTVLAGPSAVGKGTVVSALRRRHPEVVVSVSATTRDPRPGEIPGTTYFYVSEDRFDELVREGRMLEWNRYGDHRYGTPREPVEEALAQGRPVVLEIDVNGARQVRDAMPDALLVFLVPPSWEELRRRLAGRGTETDEEREERLRIARAEMGARAEFDRIVTNSDVEEAAAELARCMGLE